MALITQAVRNVGAAGLAARCGTICLSCLPPAIPLSAELTILVGHTGTVKHALFPQR